MLRIKSDVDLKELENYGLEFKEENGKYEYIERNYSGVTYIFVNSWNRKILFVQGKNYDDICLTILYDLIQARISRESRGIKMRNIKFRGKYLDDTSEWLYGNYVYIEDDVFQHKIADKSGLLLDIDIETLGQYTGLHDKNGKEIYEGDVLKFADIYKGIIEYSERYAQFVLKEMGNIDNEFEALGEFNIEEFEVIGNIYDNTNLLEKGE